MNGGLLDNGTIGSSQLAGGFGTVNAVVSGSAAFTKTGSGIPTLPNIDTYSGQTLVTQGTLLISGTLTQSQATVSSAATLGGPANSRSVSRPGGGALADPAGLSECMAPVT